MTSSFKLFHIQLFFQHTVLYERQGIFLLIERHLIILASHPVSGGTTHHTNELLRVNAQARRTRLGC